MKFWTVVTAALLVPGAALAFELKGFEPGKAVTQMQQLYPNLRCEGSTTGERYCMYFATHPGRSPMGRSIEQLDTLAGVVANTWKANIYGDGKIGTINVRLDAQGFEAVAGALTEKYGKATKTESSTMKTRVGAEYDQVEMTWISGDELLKIRKYAGDIKTMAVDLTSKEAVEAEVSARADEAKKGAKDL